MLPARRLLPLSALFLAVAIGRPAEAARYLEFTVEVDGQTVLIGPTGDNGRQTPTEVWRRWSEVHLEAQSAAAFPPPLSNPDSCTLQGDIVLRVRHSSRILGEARVEQLSLVKSRPEIVGWSLPESEVVRTAAAAGLPPASSRSAQSVIRRLVQVAATGVLIGLLLAVVAIARRSRRQTPELSASAGDP